MKLARNAVVLLPALALLAGCVSTPELRYFSPTKTVDDLLKTRLQCFVDLQKKTPKPDCGAVDACLVDRGFMKSDSGNLKVPEGAVLECQEAGK